MIDIGRPFPTTATLIQAGIRKTLIGVFVDASWPHRWWHCHRLPERSFSIDGRQFHVCARCTGLVVGFGCSWILVPVRHLVPWVAAAFLLVLSADGLTQLIGWRSSNNALRLLTGLGVGATGLGAVLALCGW